LRDRRRGRKTLPVIKGTKQEQNVSGQKLERRPSTSMESEVYSPKKEEKETNPQTPLLHQKKSREGHLRIFTTVQKKA